MTARTVLITGAGGFVGGALAGGFAGLGWDVVAVDRDFDDAVASDGVAPGGVASDRAAPDDMAPGGVRRVVWDVGGASAPNLAADVIIHAAWITADPATLGVSDDEYIELNLRPLMSMITSAKSTTPAAFVFVSSSGVFAATDGDDGLTDDTVPTGSSPYARAKRMGERLVRTELGAVCRVLVVRLGYLYGPGENARASRPGVSLVAQWIEAATAGDPLPVREDDPAREWTFAPDLAPVLSRMLGGPGGPEPAEATDVPTDRPIHVGSPHVLRDSALAEIIAAHHPGAAITHIPAGPPAKPPMTPSDLPAIRDFAWTDPAAGLDAMLGAGTAS